MLDSLKDIKDNIVDRIKNPFAGTFILTWLLHNWFLVYSLLNFDSGTSLHAKTDFIEEYIKNAGYWKLLWLPVIHAFAAIILYLLFTNLSYAIFMLSTKWAKPKIHQLLDRNSLILRTVYNGLQTAFIKVQKEKEDAIANLSKVVEERTILEKSTGSLKSNITELEQGSEALKAEIANKDKTISEQIEQVALYRNMSEKTYEIPDDLSRIFQGHWRNDHIYADGTKGEEFFIFSNSQYCIIDAGGLKPTFSLDMIRIDKKLKILHFRKVGIPPDNRTCENTLVFEDLNRLVGYEAEGTEVIYTKVDINKVEIVSAQYGGDGKFNDMYEQ